MDHVRDFVRFKESLSAGRVTYGTMLQEIGTTNIVKVIAKAGFDFYVIDCEHGPFGFETVSNLLSATDTEKIIPIVRIPEIRKEPIQKTLDAGAGGVLVPSLTTVEEAREAVRLARYPPEGRRGNATFKPWSSYTMGPAETMLPEANRGVLIVLQIETREAVECIDAILAVEGVDAALVGPGDLSLSYDLPGKTQDPVIVSAIDRVVLAAKRRGKPCGIHCVKLEEVLAWRAKGMSLLVWSAPIIMVFDACRHAISKLKGTPR